MHDKNEKFLRNFCREKERGPLGDLSTDRYGPNTRLWKSGLHYFDLR
jgi:hypothetical protein